MKKPLPNVRLDAQPAGLKFRAPQSAVSRWDKRMAAAKADGEITILGEIGESYWSDNFTTAKMVKDQLKALGKDPVLVTINSPGGNAFEGVAIYNLLREHPGNVTVNVIGLAASAASIIAMAGDKVNMGEAAMLMIHSAWGIVGGNQEDMRAFADFLDAIDQSVAGLYAARTGMSSDDALELMRNETWMSAADAVAKGFADTVTKSKKGANAALDIPIHAALPGARAASGAQRSGAVRLSIAPGASGPQSTSRKEDNVKIAEQIVAYENKRAANIARMNALMEASAEAGQTLDAAQTEEYDGLQNEVDTIDSHLVRLKAHEARMVADATRSVSLRAVGEDPDAGLAARGGAELRGNIISVRANLEQGIPFVRYVKAMVRAKGIPEIALSIAKSNQTWRDQTPEVEKVLMAAVAAGDTTTAGWASELVYNQNLVSAFLDYLRPKTIIGRIKGFTPVPFNVRWGTQTSGSTGYWVGQGLPIPVSKLATGSDSLGIAKAAGLVVLAKELMMSSSPSAEVLVRNDLANSIAQFLDVNFIAPDYAAVANVNPASITNGVTPTVATGATAATMLTDTNTLFGIFDSNNLSTEGAFWVMTPGLARNISAMLNSFGQPLYPTMTPDGGMFRGYPAVVSGSAVQVGSPVSGEGQLLVLMVPREIAMADEGQITIDASAEASIQMLDNPTNASAGATVATTMVSMFQTDSIALRAIRFINWKKRRTFAVAYIKDAAYLA